MDIRILALAMLVATGLASTTRADPKASDPKASDPKASDTFDPTEKTAIQSVITRQLDAFDHENAKAAEAFAAPAIKDRFPEASQFFDMVKEHYAALIHRKSTSFGDVEPSPHGPLQKMTIVAADGTVWTAIYSFEKVDGEWRITGCGLEKVEGQQDI